MRPPKADSNLYNYHLKLLQNQGLIVRHDAGYALGVKGIQYIDRISGETGDPRPQPKIITMSVVQNDEGGVLMYQKLRQPFIGQWTIPFGKVHDTDMSLAQAAQREAREKLGTMLNLEHVGDCYIRIVHDGQTLMSTFAHVFYGLTNEPLANERLSWIDPYKLTQLDTTPAIKDIVARTFFRDPYFFEEYTEELAQ